MILCSNDKQMQYNIVSKSDVHLWTIATFALFLKCFIEDALKMFNACCTGVFGVYSKLKLRFEKGVKRLGNANVYIMLPQERINK